jgi:hypothetical protein
MTSRGTDAVISCFEQDHSRTVTIETGELKAPPGEIRGANTMSKRVDPDATPTEFKIILNRTDIEKTNTAPDAVVIHEVVGHLGPNSERTQKDADAMGEAGREKDAQQRTVNEVKQIPADRRPELPKTHLQPKDKAKPSDV